MTERRDSKELILKALRKGPKTVREISKMTGLPATTISNRCNSLVKTKDIHIYKIASSGRGPACAFFKLGPTPKGQTPIERSPTRKLEPKPRSVKGRPTRGFMRTVKIVPQDQWTAMPAKRDAWTAALFGEVK